MEKESNKPNQKDLMDYFYNKVIKKYSHITDNINELGEHIQALKTVTDNLLKEKEAKILILEKQLKDLQEKKK